MNNTSFLLSLNYQVKLQEKQVTIYTHTETQQISLTASFQILVSVWSLLETFLAVQSGKMGQCENGQQACWLRNVAFSISCQVPISIGVVVFFEVPECLDS